MASFDSGFGFFNSGDMNDPRVNSLLRQKIAMGLLASKKGYPKNIGEGLTAIGDAIGNAGIMSRLSEFDLAQQDKANADYKAMPPEAPSGSPVQPQRQATSYGQTEPDEQDEPAVTTPAAAMAQGAARGVLASRGAAPLTTAPSQPSSMLHPNIPTLRDTAPPTPAAAQTPVGLGGGSGATSPPSGQAVPTPSPLAAAQGADTPAVSPRDAIAAAMLPKPPVMAADDQATPQTTFKAQNMLPMPPQGMIPAAPPSAGSYPSTAPQQGPAAPQPGNQISAAPPIDAPIMAQSAPPRTPTPNPAYVTPNPGPVPQVAQVPMSPQENRIRRLIADNPGNPYYATTFGPQLKQLEEGRALQQKQLMEQHGSNLIMQRDLVMQREKALADQAKRQQDYDLNKQKFIATGGPDMNAAQLSDLNTPRSPQRSGTPTIPKPPPGTLPEKWSEEMTKSIAADTIAYPKAKGQFNTMLDLLDQAKNHPGHARWGVGPLSKFASGVVGSPELGFSQLMKQIEGKNFLEGYASIRGAGQISNIEGEKTEKARARLLQSQSKDDFNKAMYDLEHQVRTDFELMQRKMNVPVTAWNKVGDPNAMPAPDIGTRSPQGTMEYIGGDPNDPMGRSWRRRQ